MGCTYILSVGTIKYFYNLNVTFFECRFAAAELDCTQAIALDQRYTKAYFRRATARVHMDKLKEAKNDVTNILSIDPSNKQAKSELVKIEKVRVYVIC